MQNLRIKSLKDNKLNYRGSIKARFKTSTTYEKAALNSWDFEDSLQNGEFLVYSTEMDVYKRIEHWSSIYKPGDRICQLIIMPYPKINFNQVEELSASVRGEGGYGSTGV